MLFLALLAVYAAPVPAAILDEPSSDYQWRLCPATRFIPIKPGYTDTETDRDATEIRADSTRLVKGGLSQFTGDVEVVRGEKAIRADVVTYDDARGVFEAEGRAHIWDTGVTWAGERATYQLDTEFSVLENGRYWIQNGHGRGSASVLSNDSPNQLTVLEDVDYSTCPLSDEAWRLEASRITLNHATDRGAATNAVLRVRDVPVFYFPYINFPISDKRKTGFLAPTVGTTNDSGIDARLPFYWNIAPNYDATLEPRVVTDRGVMLGGEGRYLNETYGGQLVFSYLPSDDIFGDDRSSVAFRHGQNFDENRGQLRVTFNNVSDDEYFADFGRSLGSTSQRFLDRQVNVNYRMPNALFQSTVQSYQVVDDSLPAGAGPYRRLPQFRLWAWAPRAYKGFYPTVNAETTYFDRAASVTGGRIDLEPAISYLYVKPYLDIRPKLTLKHTEYFLDDPKRVIDDRESRSVPIFSLDAKLFMERMATWFGNETVQTFEPRLHYLLIPHVPQDDLPVFDTGLYDISLYNLFTENRFTGRDRVGDTNRVALAATTRSLEASTGYETYRFSLGQIFYFRDREVTLPGRTETRDNFSEVVAETVVALGGDWKVRGALQWDPEESRTEKAALSFRYQPDFETVVNLGYRLRRAVTDVEQTDLSFRWPLTDRLAAVGRWNYSIQDSRSLETVGGIEYESCCWGMRLVGRRFLRNAAGAYDTGVFVQVHLRGLGGIGRQAETFLQRGIPGYEDPFE